MNKCIFCESESNLDTIEHIVPESLGNITYIMPHGSFCAKCNNEFSKFEKEALSHSIFGVEKTRMGIKTKSGKVPKVNVGDLEIEGDKAFRKNIIKVNKGLEGKLTLHNPNEQIFQLRVSTFEKNEVANSKFFLMMALESIYTSQKKTLYNKYDFSELICFLNKKDNRDWPFIISKTGPNKFKSIPRFQDKMNLKEIRCELGYLEYSADTLLFKFSYGAISATINSLNRNLAWLPEYIASDSNIDVYPKHFLKKLSAPKTT